MITMGTGITGTANNTYFTSSDTSVNSVVVNSTPRKKREPTDKLLLYRVHKPKEHISFIIENFEKKINTKISGMSCTLYFANFWITGLFLDKNKKEVLNIKPRKQLCRVYIDSESKIKDAIRFAENFEDNVYTSFNVEDLEFSSNKIKKCFSEQEAYEHYSHLKDIILSRLDKEIEELKDIKSKL